MKLSTLALCAALSVLTLACTGDKPEKKDDTPADAVAKAAQVRRPLDAGALLTDEGSTREAKRLDVTATVTQRFKDGGTSYAMIVFPTPDAGPYLRRQSATIRAGAVYGLAALPTDSYAASSPGSNTVLLARFVGDAPDSFSFTLRGGLPYTEEVDTLVRVSVTTPKTLKGDKTLIPAFFLALSDSLNGNTGFHAFASQRAALLAAASSTQKPADALRTLQLERPRRSSLAQTTALYTGMSAVEESLQHDRGLRLADERVEARTVDLATIPGVQLAAHDWPALIAKLPTKPVIEPMAALIPADMAYIHFHDLRELSRLSGEVDGWIMPLLRAVEQRGEDSELAQRYEDQLALRKTKLSEQLGHVAAQGVAVVTSDPFLREGSDLTVVFHVRSKPALDGALDKLLAERLAERPDATTTTYALGAHTVTRTATADGHVERHRLDLGEHVLISNSRAALARIVEASEGKVASLAKSGDFQYMRARYPYDIKAETAFVFIGDAFVANAVSPRAKIGASRRLMGVSDVMAVNNAALLFGWLHGRQPASVDEIVKARLLDPSELVHEGAKISWDAAAGAASERWGDVRFQRPLIEVALDKVTQSEADEYNRWRESYQRYWRGLIDPIGISLKRAEDGSLAIDGRMLPIIDSSDYNELIALTGQRTFVPGNPVGALQWTFALGDDARLRLELNRALASTVRNRDLTVDWIGDWIAVGAADRGVLWDILLYWGALGAARDEVREQAQKKRIDDLNLMARMPVYVMVQIKSPAVLAAALTALRKEVEGSAPGMVVWGPSAPYREVQTVAIAENLLQTGRVGLPLQLHYATVKGVFIAAPDRMVLEQCIDMILDDRGPASVDPAKPSPAATQSEIVYNPWPEQSWLSKSALGMLERDARWGFTRSMSNWEVLAQGLGQAPTDAQALAYTGRALAKPHGQPFVADQDGLPTHPIYGGITQAKRPVSPVKGSPVTAAVEALRAARVDVMFEGEAAQDRGLRVRVGLTRGK